MPLMNEVALAEGPCEPVLMDALWARGWRHFGPMFFRYSETNLGVGVRHVIPLRIDLERFRLSESQRRTLRRNTDLHVSFGSPVIGVPERTLFHAHASRFRENIPSSPESFLGSDPASWIPCEIRQLSVAGDGGRLLAASYVAVGIEAWSSSTRCSILRHHAAASVSRPCYGKSSPPGRPVAAGSITATRSASRHTTITRKASLAFNGTTGRDGMTPLRPEEFVD